MTISTYADGKILRWAWLSRGYVTAEVMAEWQYGGDVAELAKSMQQVRHKLKDTRACIKRVVVVADHS
eukprot:10924258-Prorocentrum_lima.AAC.1